MATPVTVDVLHPFDRMSYCEGTEKEWSRLPEWCGWLAATAERFAASGLNGATLVLLVPTRAYAVLLCGMGVMRALVRAQDATSIGEHASCLMALEPGSPVSFRTTVKGRLRSLKGQYQGHKRHEGRLLFGVQVQLESEGGLTYWEPEARAELIQPDLGEAVQLPERPKGVAVRGLSEFVAFLLGRAQLTSFCTQSTCEIMFVAPRIAFANEVKETKLSVSTERGDRLSGGFQEVLRVSELQPGHPWRSRLMLSTCRKAPRALSGLSPVVVVLDGSLAFLRWRHAFPSSRTIAVLDRTEARFGDALRQVQQDLALHNRIELDCAGMPRCVDSVVYGREE